MTDRDAPREAPPTDLLQLQEVQCKRCGSSMDLVTCEECRGDGDCDVCKGAGGKYECRSSPEHCKANPLPHREKVKRSTEEWFNV